MIDTEIIERLVRMETKLDQLLISYNHHIEDHEGRIRDLEASAAGDDAVHQWKVAVGLGGCALLIALIAAIAQVVGIWV